MIKKFLNELKIRKKVMEVFKAGDIRIKLESNKSKPKDKTTPNKYKYPKIHSIKVNDKQTTINFTIPNGFNPDKVHDKIYCFKQVFPGKKIKLEGDTKKFKLKIADATTVFKNYDYKYHEFSPLLCGHNLPIICGKDEDGNYFIYDMVHNPHLIIAGETGSGKSSQVRSILSTIFKFLKPEQLEAYLCDLKRSEFHLFRNIKHVKKYAKTIHELKPLLGKISEEMKRRGDLFDEAEVDSILSYNKVSDDKLSFILVVIDEVALLQKEEDLMSVVEEISTIGRSLGVFLILSMQRPDYKVLDGKLKQNCTVRMGFKAADAINSNIVGTPGSEDLEVSGRFLLKLTGLTEFQAPYLELDDAKQLLEPLKCKSAKAKKSKEITEQEKLDLFGVL
ncbi:MAG: ftsK/SpoIIIE family protein [Bacillales bacterium]|jgi:S-DNA-T family DNA segregation ATPase FtsK/SpoIIIE|nr:ftsK/SpoIIIE family protein [Bacillales bacterium]